MEPIPPKIAPDRDSARPLICLGDANGESCRENWTQVLRHSLIESFGLEAADVTINQPFAGGYITRTYGNRPVPWIQVELNRKLYLSDADFDSDSLRMKTNRLSTLSEQFRRAIGQFVTRIHARR